MEIKGNSSMAHELSDPQIIILVNNNFFHKRLTRDDDIFLAAKRGNNDVKVLESMENGAWKSIDSNHRVIHIHIYNDNPHYNLGKIFRKKFSQKGCETILISHDISRHDEIYHAFEELKNKVLDALVQT